MIILGIIIKVEKKTWMPKEKVNKIELFGGLDLKILDSKSGF